MPEGPIGAERCPRCGAPCAPGAHFCRQCGCNVAAPVATLQVPAPPRRRYLVEPWWVGPVIVAANLAALALLELASGAGRGMDVTHGADGSPQFHRGAINAGQFGTMLLGNALLVGLPMLAGYYVRGLWPRIGCFGLFAVVTLLIGAAVVAAIRNVENDGYTAFAALFAGIAWAMAGGGFALGGIAGGVVSAVGRRRERRAATPNPA